METAEDLKVLSNGEIRIDGKRLRHESDERLTRLASRLRILGVVDDNRPAIESAPAHRGSRSGDDGSESAHSIRRSPSLDSPGRPTSAAAPRMGALPLDPPSASGPAWRGAEVEAR